MKRPLVDAANDLRDGETYLGDYIYASFDGRVITLRAPEVGGKPAGDEQVMYINFDTYVALSALAKSCWRPKVVSV